MSSLLVAGPTDGLRGHVAVAGLKTAAVPVLASAVAVGGDVVIENVPNLVDLRVMVRLCQGAGVPMVYDPSSSRIEVRAFGSLDDVVLDDPIATTCHGPIYLVPAFAAVADNLRVRTDFGGCAIGLRPTAHIEHVVTAAGHDVRREAAALVVRRGPPRNIDLDLRSLEDWWVMRSGATKTAVMLAMADQRGAHVSAPYIRAPVAELLRFATLARGVDSIATDDLLVVNPGGKARPTEIALRGDYLEALTWLSATAIATGDVTVTGFDPGDCSAELDLLAASGAELSKTADGVRIVVDGPLVAQSFVTDVIDTDAQPLLGTVMALARGPFVIEERIWADRFGWVDALRANGANLTHIGPKAVAGRGVDRLTTDPVLATDLRAATALAVAALRQPNPTRIDGWEHVARGIDRFVAKLGSLGAVVQEVTLRR